MGWNCSVTYLLTYAMLPLRRPALVIGDARSLHAANETVPLQSDVNSSSPKHLTMRATLEKFLAAMDQNTACTVDEPDEELEDI